MTSALTFAFVTSVQRFLSQIGLIVFVIKTFNCLLIDHFFSYNNDSLIAPDLNTCKSHIGNESGRTMYRLIVYLYIMF